MTEQHPITPPPELVREWTEEGSYADGAFAWGAFIANQAARWGADKELKACCEWAATRRRGLDDDLHAARRLKLFSLKEQALGALHAVATGADDTREFYQDIETIKQALESLPE